MSIDRREALRRTAMIMGGALSAPSIAAILNGCSASPELNWKPSFFTEEQATLVMEVAEDIIPQTATAGAKQVGVPKFIEEMVHTRYEEKDRELFMASLNAFEAECLEKHGDNYVSLENETRLAILNEENDKIKEGPRYGKKPEKSFFWRMKELTLLGYFTSEVGATQVLQYKAIPVEYNGCIPLSEAGGKTWAT